MGVACMAKRIGTALVLAATLAGCATTANNPADPFEPLNRAIFSFNDTLDTALVRPVAKGYHDALPNWFRAGVSNFFGNIGYYNLMRSNDGTVTAAWSAAYNTIFTSNLFVKNLMKAEQLVSPDKLNQYLGEAAFIRAYNYFYLVNFWGPTYTDPIKGPDVNLGVPLVLTCSPPDRSR